MLRQPVDPLRFRGNLYIDGLEAWGEMRWVGKEIAVGDAVRLKVVDPIGRCAATNVDPKTGVRDLNIPLTLRRGFGHSECGVYAKVVQGGVVKTGDALAPPV